MVIRISYVWAQGDIQQEFFQPEGTAREMPSLVFCEAEVSPYHLQKERRQSCEERPQ